MCTTCGCSDANHHHHHSGEDHSHHLGEKSIVEVEKDILYQNNLLAERNRGYFDAKNIFCINLVSSPGSGKTTLLERTLTDLKGDLPFSVIEGDQQTTNDADRIHATGTKVTQINTGKGCHLDSHMVMHALQGLKPPADSVLFIENVGNLVCPAMFDLGEKERVVIISVTEGDDKPVKYPDMFHTSTVCIINKMDLLPYVNFNVEKAKEYALKVNHKLKFFEVSATTGQGMEAWYSWLKQHVAALQEV
jgi:hydrogenase nickel incorporation protein HypB